MRIQFSPEFRYSTKNRGPTVLWRLPPTAAEKVRRKRKAAFGSGDDRKKERGGNGGSFIRGRKERKGSVVGKEANLPLIQSLWKKIT